ncbi:MAG: hypothetical protein Q8T13_23645 [Acidobacteriota bacterium]|nr:hypothetical protein [Acidobacteriota bacterium]
MPPDLSNATPYEIIAAPFTIYLAPVGTAFPPIDVEPDGDWTKVGVSGDRNYTEEGVKVSNPQTIAKFKSAGSTGARKAWRTDEELMISFELADMTLEAWKIALNGNVVTNESGAPRKIGMTRGRSVTQYSLIARGPSPYGDDFAMQYEVPVCIQTGNPEPVKKKDQAAALALQFEALEDPNATSDDERFGRIVAQDSVSDT